MRLHRCVGCEASAVPCSFGINTHLGKRPCMRTLAMVQEQAIAKLLVCFHSCVVVLHTDVAGLSENMSLLW